MPSLWIPESAKPAFQCTLCGHEYTRREQAVFERHMASCSVEHHDRIEAERAPMRKFNEHVDPEWEAYNASLRAQGLNPEVQYNRGRRTGIRRASES